MMHSDESSRQKWEWQLYVITICTPQKKPKRKCTLESQLGRKPTQHKIYHGEKWASTQSCSSISNTRGTFLNWNKGIFQYSWWLPGLRSTSRWAKCPTNPSHNNKKEIILLPAFTFRGFGKPGLSWKKKSLRDEVWVFCDVVIYGFEFWFLPGELRQVALSLTFFTCKMGIKLRIRNILRIWNKAQRILNTSLVLSLVYH